MRTIISLFALVAFMAVQVVAQEKAPRPKLNPEAKAALKAFQKEKVYPVRKAAHDQFLASLNDEDRTFLAAKQQEANKIMAEAKSVRKAAKKMKKEEKSREDIKAFRTEAMAPVKEQRKALMESMKPFMERNAAAVKTALESIKPHRETWKKERQAILEQHLSAEELAALKARKEERKAKHQARKKGKGAKKGKEGVGKAQKQGKKATLFVLWDGTCKVDQMDEKSE